MIFQINEMLLKQGMINKSFANTHKKYSGNFDRLWSFPCGFTSCSFEQDVGVKPTHERIFGTTQKISPRFGGNFFHGQCW